MSRPRPDAIRLGLIALVTISAWACKAKTTSGVDGARLGSAKFVDTVTYIQRRLGETDTENNVKCWSTFRYTEDLLARVPLAPDATHLRAEFAQEFVRNLWVRASQLETDSRVRRKTLAATFRVFYKFQVSKSKNGKSTARITTKATPIEIPVLDLEDYADTAEAWRVLASVTQHFGDKMPKELSRKATEYLASRVTLFNMVLLRLAAELADERKEPVISLRVLRKAASMLRHKKRLKKLTHRANGLDARRLVVAQAILYAEGKIESLNKVNSRTPQDAPANMSTVAGMKVSPEAAAHLVESLFSSIARRLWLGAQGDGDRMRLLISGSEMAARIRGVYPYRVDATENVVFFSDSKHPMRIFGYAADALRDDTYHWKTILGLLQNEMHTEARDDARLRIPLDPYAAEELSELLSDLGVLLLKQAAGTARADKRDVIDKRDLVAAMALIDRLSNDRAAVITAPVAAVQGNDPILKSQKGPFFVDVTATSGMPDGFSDPGFSLTVKAPSGISVEDFDGDGDLDLFWSGTTPRLLLNQSNMNFEDVTARSGLASVLECSYAAGSFGDFDNDGRDDLLVSCTLQVGGKSRITLFRNEGGGQFVKMDESAIPQFEFGRNGMGTWFDYDSDGLLDLYVLVSGKTGIRPTVGDATNGPPNHLLRNNGDGTFADVTVGAGVGDTRWPWSAVPIDFDENGHPDIYIVNDFGKNVLYKNMGDGSFVDVSGDVGVADLGHGMGVSVGDYDHDGHADMYLTNMGSYNPKLRFIRPSAKTRLLTGFEQDRRMRVKEANRLYRGDGGGFVDTTKKKMEWTRTGFGWNGHFFDFDNDGHLDIHVANGHHKLSYFNHNEANVLLHFDPKSALFRDVSSHSGVNFQSNSRGGVFADFDRDGRLDLLVVGLHRPRLFKNTTKNQNRWLVIKLRGTVSNADAVGARVTVKSGALMQTQWIGSQGGNLISQTSKELHFGMGRAQKASSVSILWPSGKKQRLRNVATNRALVVTEPK